ncbi:hypothetical protein [Actibacterium sp. D379-3]
MSRCCPAFANMALTSMAASDLAGLENAPGLGSNRKMYDRREIVVNDKMQTGYRYTPSVRAGEQFDVDFKPHYSPQEMLEMGVFEGRYLNDCTGEFPAEWFQNAKTSQEADPSLNYFGVKSRQSLEAWQRKGWIYGPDPRGWFQWYCRYYLGRRIPEIDRIQIKRWKGFARHAGQIRANCHPGDVFCRPRQRQALLQWSYDPLI